MQHNYCIARQDVQDVHIVDSLFHKAPFKQMNC